MSFNKENVCFSIHLFCKRFVSIPFLGGKP
jgi:hypothetical protein